MRMGMASLADDLPTFAAAASDAYDLAYSGASFDPSPPPAPTFDSSAYFPPDHLSPSSSSLSPSSWNNHRAVKRKLEPGELLSLSQLSSSLKSTPRAPEAVVSSPLVNNDDDAGFDYAEELEHLREKIREQDKQIQSLCDDLDEERKAAASAVSETMEMIRRLNDEKAAAQLEARQMKQFADELAAHHEEELDELEKELEMKENTVADLEAQMKVYRERMKQHGIEPDGESEFEGSEGDDGGRGGIVEKQPYDSSSDWVSNSRYQMYQPRRDDADLDMKLRKILTRLEMLETDRESVRRDMMAMRAEKVQLLLMRNIATRLCTQVAAERRMVKIRSNSNAGPKFSVFGVFKWVFSVFFQSNEKRGLYGLSNTSIAFLLLLGLTSFNRSRSPQRNKS